MVNDRKKVLHLFLEPTPVSDSGKSVVCNSSTMDWFQGGLKLSEGESYVPIFRSLLRHRYMKDATKLQFWIWCLLKATYQEHKVLVGDQTVTLQPGQFIFGRKAAAEELGTTERKIRTLLKFFSCCKEQKLTIKTTNKFSVVTVVDYTTYTAKVRQNDQQNDQQATSRRPAGDHKQEGVKKGKEKNIEVPDWICEETWAAFVDMRKKIKAPMTEEAKRRAIAKLDKLRGEGHDPEDVLDQSIINAWKGLFPVDRKGGKVKSIYGGLAL